MRRLLLAVLLGLGLTATGAQAAPMPPFSHAGRWITDAQGRVVILHGLNIVDKLPPYRPDALGFGSDDAQFLARAGFDSVRLGIIWKALEPRRGHFDDRYLAHVVRTAQMLERHRIWPVIDFHQDMLNERYQGEGIPDWARYDDGLPALPRVGFPVNYVAMPALSRAFESFWTDRVGIQRAFAQAWRHVAARLHSDRGIVAFDIFNEPWPGAQRYAQCVQPGGCPAFDQQLLRPFTRRTIAAIRRADRRRLAAYEPNVNFNTGAQTYVGGAGDARAVFNFHVYCSDATPGLPSVPGGARTCPAKEAVPFAHAEQQSRSTGNALLVTEFGATDDLTRIASITGIADRYMVGWEEWAYWNTDPCCARPIEGLIRDIRRAPTGANVKHGKLLVLARPYPEAVAGTPLAWGFEAVSRRFTLLYSTQRPSGDRLPADRLTELSVPPIQYPRGYIVRVRGARVTSRSGASVLRLLTRPGAARVKVVIVPRP